MTQTPFPAQPATLPDIDAELLLNAMTDTALLVLDPHGTIVSWSKGAEQIHGWSGNEVLGHRASILYPTASDGAWLARLFAAPGSERASDQRRRQTLQMVRRAVELSDIRWMTGDLSRFICFDDQAHDDAVLAGIPQVQEWRGLMLRNQSTSAWRQLWAWLVDAVEALSTRRLLADRLADALPRGTVRQWVSHLPPTLTPAGRVAPAERLRRRRPGRGCR